jgi:hypothetical protein
MNPDGLWTFRYVLGGQKFSMIGTFHGSRLTGGNSWYYYSGTFEMIDGTLMSTIQGTHYSGETDPALGGLKQFTLEMRAKLGDNVMQGTATIVGLPLEVPFTAKKVA